VRKRDDVRSVPMADGPRFSLQEISDRLEIDDLLSRYTFAIDDKDWDALDDVFVPDAQIDYTTSGGIKGAFPEIKAWLAKTLVMFPMTQHVLGNRRVTFDGDTATSRTYFFNPMGAPKGDGGDGLQLFYVGGYYNDRLVRTGDGWRIAERFEETAWMDGLPANLQIPT
jgi:3-phenylpropionate/cinnamic acid dioxygenase small subunit